MQKFSIKNWSAWDLTSSQELGGYHQVQSGLPEMAGVKPMVKRRMPALAKVMHELASTVPLMPCVYASKNAELSRTIKIIRQYGGDISPTLFSMSVHNAIPGMLSVVNQDDSPYTVIDSMSGVVEMALLEAVSMLDQYDAVKVVYFEEPTADEYIEINKQPDFALVMQLVVTAGNAYSLCQVPKEQKSAHHEQSNLLIKEYLSLLQGDTQQVIQHHARHSWHWRRC